MRSNKVRDARGRWQKGHCPNPNGRPRKKAGRSDADIINFKNGLIKLTINDKEQLLTRHEALVHMMFMRAMKGGSVLLTRQLYELFEDADQTITNAFETLELMRRDYRMMPNKTLLKGVELADKINELEDLLTVEAAKPERNRRRVKATGLTRGPRPPSAGRPASTWRQEVRARRLAREQAEQAASPPSAAAQTTAYPTRASAGSATPAPPPADTEQE